MKKLLVLLLLVVGALVVATLAMSGEWSVARTKVMAATPAQIHATVERLSTWPEWSYWSLETDPEAKFTFSGPEAGEGCTWDWTSSGDLGEGTMTVVSSSVEDGMRYRIEMKSMDMKMDGHVAYKAVDGGTEVHFSSSGVTAGPMKLMSLFVDSMVGPSYETSLSQLEEYVSKKPSFPTPEKGTKAAAQDGEEG